MLEAKAVPPTVSKGVVESCGVFNDLSNNGGGMETRGYGTAIAARRGTLSLGKGVAVLRDPPA